jgi:hypothetical protein
MRTTVFAPGFSIEEREGNGSLRYGGRRNTAFLKNANTQRLGNYGWISQVLITSQALHARRRASFTHYLGVPSDSLTAP